MILTDTSVWIEFLKSHEPYFSQHRELLENRLVFTISPIFGELLQGVKSKSEKSIILEYWNYLPKIDETDLLVNAGIYSSENNLISKGVGLIDSALIVIALEHSAQIWTLDNKLNRIIPDKIKMRV